ncbi:MAG: pimeloyl-ACP methyl ester carboxylesterase [Alphaproteobacteria bacterium]
MSRRSVGGIDLWVEEGGRENGPTLLLMHGLSGTGEIWRGVRDILADKWPGRWIIPDMRGHGRSAHSAAYGIGSHAADMAALLDGADNPVLAGHSMGGLVGIMLASGLFGITPCAVVTAGVKVDWTDEEHAGMAKLIDMPVRWFDSDTEARERFVLVTGLKGIALPDSDLARSGVVEEDGKWRLAADNRAAMVAYANTRDIYRAAHAPVIFAAGEQDRMVNVEEQQSLDPAARVLARVGHNAHVEDPHAFWGLIADATGVAK